MELGKKLKQIRKEKKISTTELSQALNWPPSKISKIENEAQKITVEELKDICSILAIEPTVMLKDSSDFQSFSNSPFIVGGLKETFELAAQSYPLTEEERKKFAGSEVGRIITKNLPLLIGQKANIDLESYLITGSIGKGQFAEIPWISLFRKSITESATKGIYIVYLFTADMKGLYLSLNQGFTYFKDKYGTKKGRQEVQKIAQYLQRTCKSIPYELSLKTIDLKAEKSLGKGYMPGHIAGKYYEIDDLKSSEFLANDLRNLMSVYEEIIGLINGRKIEDFYDYVLAVENDLLLDEEDYNECVEESIAEYVTAHSSKLSYEPVPQAKKEAVEDRSRKKVYPRDKTIASNALILAEFKCEVDYNHDSFMSKTTNQKYMESHHLIPLEFHERFKFSLDVEANIVSLCSHCHNCIHYGVESEREEMIEKLYERRKEQLNKAGIFITLDELKKMY